MVQSASVPVAQRATNLGVGAGEPLNIDEDVSVGASEDELYPSVRTILPIMKKK